MASIGSFGVADPDVTARNYIGRSTTNTAEAAILADSNGVKKEATTHSAETRSSEEFFVGIVIPTGTAVDAQNGVSVVVSDAVSESSTDYAKQTIESLDVPG